MTASYPPDIHRYLQRILPDAAKAYACHATNAEELAAWQNETRPAFKALIGVDAIADSAEGHTPSVTLGTEEDLGSFTRARGTFCPEPDVEAPLWLLRPKGEGPFPLAVTPHGHNARGFDTYAGLESSTMPPERVREEDRDVAVQAVQAGFLAIAPATRGIAEGGVEDIDGVFRKNCRAHALHCWMAGRTSIGERVWDMMRLIDWATARPDVDGGRILMLGNSGGGVTTFHSTACDPRITIAIPSCAFNRYVTDDGRIRHCDCNLIPGIMRFGNVWDVGALIAPRHLLIVNGKDDAGRRGASVDEAADRVRAVYKAAGAADRFDLQYGHAGHQFYKDLMWPFVEKAMRSQTA